jgi:hypothetical protein
MAREDEAFAGAHKNCDILPTATCMQIIKVKGLSQLFQESIA